jgi:hypothetical protein
MDFDGAIKAHAEWKMKLTSYLKNPDKSLVAATVCQDNQCALGKWIYGEGKAYSSSPDFEELRKTHGEFHKCAGDLITRADKGEKVSDEVAFGAKSPYTAASTKVTMLIMQIKRVATKAA